MMSKACELSEFENYPYIIVSEGWLFWKKYEKVNERNI